MTEAKGVPVTPEVTWEVVVREVPITPPITLDLELRELPITREVTLDPRDYLTEGDG